MNFNPFTSFITPNSPTNSNGFEIVSVFASGVLWALAYERTRSLLPGMLAHAVSNIQATTIVLATLRF